MSLSPSQVAQIRDDARMVASAAEAMEVHLHNLMQATSDVLRQADVVCSFASTLTDLRSQELQQLCLSQVALCGESAANLNRACLTAREQHVKATRLLSRFDIGGAEIAVALEARHTVAVLVADDVSEIRELMASVLRAAGFVVRTAENGLEALIAAHEFHPAVILMDVSMPVLDGIEATRLIKSTDRLRDAKVIAHTANPPVADVIERWFAAVVSKPSSPATVLAAVQQLARA